MSKNKKVRKTFSLDKNLVEIAEKLCAAETRTMSNYINRLIEIAVKKHSAKK